MDTISSGHGHRDLWQGSMCEDAWAKIDEIVPKGPLRGRMARIVLHHANHVLRESAGSDDDRVLTWISWIKR